MNCMAYYQNNLIKKSNHLKSQNYYLECEINRLNNKNNVLNFEIKCFKEENIVLKNIINNLVDEINNLNDEINKIKN